MADSVMKCHKYFPTQETVQRIHPLNKDKFYEAINLYISGQASQVKAAKVAGCSVPTFKKYANKIYGGEELPDNLWGKNDD